MVYQEDVMKVAHHFAGLDLDDADVLRRGMSGKKTSKGQMERIAAKFRSNCKAKGYPQALTEEIWTQISSFAGYAFPKGHSASYAVESYQSLYLKCYFPLEFMVAAINNGGGFYTVETYLQEIRNKGGVVHPPCINTSNHPTVIKGKAIYLGLGYLKELERRTILRIVEERDRNGWFLSLEDFINRVLISIEQLSILIRIDAFRFTNTDRYELLWQAHYKLDKTPKKVLQSKLFVPNHRHVEIPKLATTKEELAFEQFELLGFPLCSHFDLLTEPPKNQLGRKEMMDYNNKMILIYGYVVNIKTTNTAKGKRMQFGTFLDHRGEFFDTVMFPPVAAKITFRGSGIYMIYGKVVEEFDFYSIEVQDMKKRCSDSINKPVCEIDVWEMEMVDATQNYRLKLERFINLVEEENRVSQVNKL